MGEKNSKPVSTFDPDELIRQMEEHPEVVSRYCDSNPEKIEKYVEENFWEEDVERWLMKIRKRSPDENLKVRKVDYLKDRNGASNYTSMYENSALVVRRACSFRLKIAFGNRSFDQDRDDMCVCFGLGENPNEVDRTKIVCKVSDAPGPKNKWSCFTVPSSVEDPKTVQVQVDIPANAIVSKYAMSIEITSGTKEGRKESSFQGKSVIVLFNPFSPDDSVYMANKEERDEYVLNDTGLIYRGYVYRNSPRYISGKMWDFAQFDQGVLDNVLDLLKYDSRHVNQPLKSWKKRHSPVYVSRVLSAMVNCNDDKGVLVGRWDGDYEDGVKPSTWSGSEAILRKWKEGGMAPVSYGQCWVFSGILTTALRAVGIPARSVTNFASAHDTDANLVIDKYFDADEGTEIEASSDSVWNFHVWNEGYFKRPDLPEGYDGWQIVDATPQEVSAVVDPVKRRNALYQCGPAPLKAIKEGRIDLGFDGNFIFAEVNADRVEWLVRDNKIVGIGTRRKNAVGKFISTKAVGSDERHDITSEYKYPEGSEEERMAFKRAYGRGTERHVFEFEGVELVKSKFEIKFDATDEATIGSDLVVTAKVKNITETTCKTRIRMVATSKRHIGTTHAKVKRTTETVEIKAGEEYEVKMTASYDDYANKLVDNKVVTVRIFATDTADGNTAVEERDVEFVYPNCISVKHAATLEFGKKNEIEVIITNKLPKSITNGVLEFFPRGSLELPSRFEFENPIQPQASHSEKVLITPQDTWKTLYFNVSFSSKEITDMTHYFRLRVA